MTLRTINGPTQVWVLGVRNFAQFYKAQKVIVPTEFKEKHQVPDAIGTNEGVIEIVLGADSSEIWPQQLAKSGGMILYESMVTGQKLIQGGANCAKRRKNENEVVLSALNRILLSPIGDDNVDRVIDSGIHTSPGNQHGNIDGFNGIIKEKVQNRMVPKSRIHDLQKMTKNRIKENEGKRNQSNDTGGLEYDSAINKISVFEHQGEIRTNTSNLGEENFWKEYSTTDLEVRRGIVPVPVPLQTNLSMHQF